MDRTSCYQFLYRSTATASGDERVLRQIQSQAIRNNERLGITGFLLHVGDDFVQLLEGSEQSIMEVMRRIVGDGRHKDLVVIHTDEAPCRSAPEWSMGVFTNDEGSDIPTPHAALETLLGVCRSHAWHDDRAQRAIDLTLARLHQSDPTGVAR